jgi:RNA polymerase sigma factor (sigma-70 family)
LIIGPALRTQSDRRLVTLVRDGYELAFEEIVRRYARPLGRYAATIVGGRSEDVTQDAFSKALLALRRNDGEIELRPWLFRIVRNTALNDLRDRPPVSQLPDSMPASRGPADEVEQREELVELTTRLQALPDSQRAAIVMRELEGLGHDEIAAALGLSGGGARQAIYRARASLRDGLGMLVPLPLIKALLAGDIARHAEVATGAVGSAGTGVALKATAATLLVAGTVGAGVALHSDPGPTDSVATARAASSPRGTSAVAGSPRRSPSGGHGYGGSTRSVSGEHARRHAGSAGGPPAGPIGALSHGVEGGQHSTTGRSDPSSHDGTGSDTHSTSGGDHSGSGGSGSGDLGSGGDPGSGASGDGSGSSEPSASDSGGSGGSDSTQTTESMSGGSESTDGISGDSRDSSDANGLIEEMSPLN